MRLAYRALREPLNAPQSKPAPSSQPLTQREEELKAGVIEGLASQFLAESNITAFLLSGSGNGSLLDKITEAVSRSYRQGVSDALDFVNAVESTAAAERAQEQ